MSEIPTEIISTKEQTGSPDKSIKTATTGSSITRVSTIQSSDSYIEEEGHHHRISIDHSHRPSWKSITTDLTANLLTQLYAEPHSLQQIQNHPLAYLDNAGVINAVRELEKTFRGTKVENGVFYRFLEKNDPQCLEDMSVLLQAKKPTERISSQRPSLFARSFSRRSSISSVPQMVMAAIQQQAEKEPLKININQKCDLIIKDMEELQEKAEKSKKHAHKIKCELVAKLEEMEKRIEELQNSLESFRRFKETTDNMTLEKFQRFMDEWSKKSRLMADKIRLRYSSLKVQLHKLSVKLAHKQLIGENLQEIDFENLKIENLHIAEKIEMKTILLLELKKMTGEGNLKLSQQKMILLQRIAEKEAIAEAIDRVEKDIFKSDDEIVKLYTEIQDVKDEFYRVESRLHNLVVPDLMVYVRKKAQLDNAKKELKMWSQRKHIKEIALDFEIKAMKKLLRCKLAHPCWFE